MTTQTVTQALQAIPQSHAAYSLAQRTLGQIALAASVANPAHANGAKRELPSLLASVVTTLISSGDYPASSVLAAFTLRSSDCGVTGTMNVATVATAGVY